MRRWHWPTEEGWLLMAFLVLAGVVAGGWTGAVIMVSFFVLVNVLGNWFLP